MSFAFGGRSRLPAVAFLLCLITASLTFAETAPSASDDDSGVTVVATVPAASQADLLASQRDYVSALLNPNQTAATNSYLDALRNDLRLAVMNAVTKPGGGEVEVAVKSAAVQFFLDRVRLFERAIGSQALTTRWSLFEATDLTSFEQTLKAELARQIEDAARYPDGTEPTPLKGRIAEIQDNLNSLTLESELRADGKIAGANRAQVSSSLSGEQQTLLKALSNRSETEEHAASVLYEAIELRLNWNHANVTEALLKGVQREILRGPHRSALVARVIDLNGSRFGPFDGPRPSDPSPGITPPDNPFSPSGGATQDLRDAAFDEIEARRSGDGVRLADATARRQINAKGIRLVTGTAQDAKELALAVMSDEDLGKLLASYQDWQSALLESKARNVATWHGEAELLDTGRWVENILSEQRARAPPPDPDLTGLHGQADVQAALRSGQPPSLEAEAFADTLPVELERERLAALQIQLDQPQLFIDTALESAARKQSAQVVKAEIAATNSQYKSLAAAIEGNLQSGRAAGARLAGGLEAAALQKLCGQAQALSEILVKLSTESELVEILKGTSIEAALLSSSVQGSSYSPELVSEIAVRIRSAANTQALPRAPPLLIDVPSNVSAGILRAPASQANIVRSGTAVLPTGDFDGLYNRTLAESYDTLVKDIRLAPGGVIVDVAFPSEFTDRYQAFAIDPADGQLRINLDGIWRKVVPAPGSDVVRAAWAFVSDQRVAAVDIRPLDLPGQQALAQARPGRSVSWLPSQRARLNEELLGLRSVNISPAIVDTGIGRALIGADELIFEALSIDPIFEASRQFYRGIDVTDLRARLALDEKDLGIGPSTVNFKSILSVAGPTVAVFPDRIELEFTFRYEVYHLFSDKEPMRLPRVSAWFADHDRELRQRSPELKALENFATAVATVRSAKAFQAATDISPMLLIGDEVVTPRYLCRRRNTQDCELPMLRKLLE
ncbi:hypothetical protein ELI07_32870 (plasmid) [Rhizobium leguminosarum]|uniref:hypothetical protein n=1 Tax=Rhizobium leguminosarum TaxID=384 RepID=UPI001031AC1E|nr:hypothetical protein [Rhizobium leguminosarum]TAX01979.1 hypothetical protein ELI07_32870 [Rhizobium leguminosarum]TAZ03247.1 hypothetical protein ELH81_31025 [Rhizobium leguminosarum]